VVEPKIENSPDSQKPDSVGRPADASSRWSTLRENLVEHMFLAEILQEAWFVREQQVEVLKAEVDAFGYDLVLECNGILRHVQLKASEETGYTSRQTINSTLENKSGACIVWIVLKRIHEIHRFEMTYLFFGGAKSDLPMPSLGEVVGMNPRSKTIRANTRVIKKNQFERISTTTELLNRMFGEHDSSFGLGISV
jgi:hypothetical protein